MTTSDKINFLTPPEIAARMASGAISSVQLVTACLDQIDRHNWQGKKLKALVAVAPRDVALKRAQELDEERKAGRVRSALHGVPIVLKDVFVTDPALGMPTSGGAAFFATLSAKKNATFVDRLMEAGVVVIGKGNLTEFCGMKSNDTPLGWSAHGGQTLSAYRRDDLEEEDQPSASGSSCGPTVAVSAGFAPISIGSETAGSVVIPAGANGVYGLKLTMDTVPLEGVCKLSSGFDCIGIFSRDPTDLAPLMSILTGENNESKLRVEMKKGFNGLAVGALPIDWGVDKGIAKGTWDQPSTLRNYEAAVKSISDNGGKTVYPIDAEAATILKYKDDNLRTVAYHEFPSNIAEFVKCFHDNPDVQNLKDLVKWNESHADIAMPEPCTGQTELIAAANDTMTDKAHDTALSELRRIARTESIAKAMNEHNLDIVLGPESMMVSVAACAGWPIASVPLGRWEKNGQPYGLLAMTRGGKDDVLLRFMAGWHGVIGGCELSDLAKE